MRIDQFRVRIQQIQSDNDRRQLNRLLYTIYPDVVSEVHETLGSSQGTGGTPIDFDINASAKGIFVLKKLVERFDPWLTIEGHTRLDRSDFPERLFKNVSEGGVGSKWSGVQKRISTVMEEAQPEIVDADYYRVIISQVDNENRDRRYLNEVRHDFSEAFLKINEIIGSSTADIGTPSDFCVEKSEVGFYVLKKCIERFDPWITVLSVKQYDKVDIPDGLFGMVNEGGVGKYWSDAAEQRVRDLGWP